MKPRFFILTLSFGLAILALIFYLRPVKRAATSEPTTKTVQTTNNALASSVNIANGANQNTSNPQPSVTFPANPEPIMSDDERHMKVFRKYNDRYNAPVDFYGQVIDMESNPVPDVKINVSIYSAFLMSPTNIVASNNIVRIEEQSGTDGRFQITGEKGYSISLDSILKDGYELSPDTHRSYNSVDGNLENPVTIKVRKISQ